MSTDNPYPIGQHPTSIAARAKLAAEAAAAEATALAPYRGFLDTLSPVLRARARKTLDTNRLFDGNLCRIVDAVADRVSAGWRVVDGGSIGPRLQSPDGRFLIQRDITKLALDLARYLSLWS